MSINKNEYVLACAIMEEYWGKYGYYGDEWWDAWQELEISPSVKQEVLAMSELERGKILSDFYSKEEEEEEEEEDVETE